MILLSVSNYQSDNTMQVRPSLTKIDYNLNERYFSRVHQPLHFFNNVVGGSTNRDCHVLMMTKHRHVSRYKCIKPFTLQSLLPPSQIYCLDHTCRPSQSGGASSMPLILSGSHKSIGMVQ